MDISECIRMLFLGMFYVTFYDHLRFVSKKYDSIPYYGMIPMTLFFATNDDRFFTQVLSTSTLYKIILFYLIFSFFVLKTKSEKQ